MVGFAEFTGFFHRNRQQLAGWANFYQYTDFKALVFQHLDRIVFWKFAHWLARKYRKSIKSLMQKHVKRPAEGVAKTWLLFGISGNGNRCGIALRRLVSGPNLQFRYRNAPGNPYLLLDPNRKTVTSRYRDIAMALSRT